MRLPLTSRFSRALFITAFLSGCAIFGAGQVAQLNERFGQPQVRERVVTVDAQAESTFLHQVKPILDNRCVVCHSCYDAPCQLKLSSPAGIDRGASKKRVYDTRVRTAQPTRLHVDARNTTEWRKRDFFSVLNEREQTPEGNLESSVFFQMLTLKNRHPLPVGGDQRLPETSFDLELNREQQCTTIEHFPSYARNHALGGMPYALPALTSEETATLSAWLAKGAHMTNPSETPAEYQDSINQWEAFFNGDSLKQQLASRYIYEHLFLAHVYFDQLPETVYYRLVRSSTPPSEPISQIQTRLPFEDPGVDRVYYRFWRDPATIVAKNHLPYALNPHRMAWLQDLFIDEPYDVTQMPNYQRSVASNPFVAFDAIPTRSRYRFMLEEARYTIMGFIKGPVCRGQVALNSIQDHFWVMFVNPEQQNTLMLDAFLMNQGHNLVLPGSLGGFSSLLKSWSGFAKKNRDYLMAKMHAMEALRPDDEPLTTDYIWDGDNHNKNAALTVFRHFDSATVVNGFVGEAPKTAWLINYTLLERIHYLLVAEFDVYGNVGHQLSTRLYMDFLRQEGEISFLTLLPKSEREKLHKFWYREADEAMSQHMDKSKAMFDMVSGIELLTDNPQLELYQILRQHLSPVLEDKYAISHPNVPTDHRPLLSRISRLAGNDLRHFPEIALLTIDDENGKSYLYSILRNLAHSNITSLFSEESTRLPEEDYLTVTRGVVGDYPSVFWRVTSSDLEGFGDTIANLADASDYAQFMTRYGVRRSHSDFWPHSDKVLATYADMEPIDAGLLDYSRLENR